MTSDLIMDCCIAFKEYVDKKKEKKIRFWGPQLQTSKRKEHKNIFCVDPAVLKSQDCYGPLDTYCPDEMIKARNRVKARHYRYKPIDSSEGIRGRWSHWSNKSLDKHQRQ